MKVCIAASGGGHLTEILQVKKAWSGMRHYFISDVRNNSKELAKSEKVYFFECPRRNPISFLKNFFQSLKILLKEKPDVIVSTGADTALSTCVLGKLLGKKLVFIESYCRVSEASLSGKICYKIADVFFVQWKENLKFFPNARFAGGVF